MSFKTLDPIKEYRSKQFRTLPIVDLAASCCTGSLDNLSGCMTAASYERVGADPGSCGPDPEKPSPGVSRLNKVGAKSVMKCVLRTLSPVSICGRMGRDCRVDDLASGETFYEMVLGPEDQPREVCRLTNANFNFVDTLDASPRSDVTWPEDSYSKHAAQPLSPEPASASIPSL